MPSESEAQLKIIEEALSKGGHEILSRFLLNCLGGTPIIGGGFSGAAGLWSEKEQELTNRATFDYLKITDERIAKLEKSLVQQSNHNEVVAGFITFNPNTVEIIDSSGVSSISDIGTLDFSINYSESLDGYVFNYYGSGPVALECAIQNSCNLNIKFERACPDTVTLVFYKI